MSKDSINHFSATTLDAVRLGMATGILDERVGQDALDMADEALAKLQAGEDCSDEPFGLLQCQVNNDFLDQPVTVRLQPTLRGPSSRVTLYRGDEPFATLSLAEFMAAKEGVFELLAALLKQMPELMMGGK